MYIFSDKMEKIKSLAQFNHHSQENKTIKKKHNKQNSHFPIPLLLSFSPIRKTKRKKKENLDFGKKKIFSFLLLLLLTKNRKDSF